MRIIRRGADIGKLQLADLIAEDRVFSPCLIAIFYKSHTNVRLSQARLVDASVFIQIHSVNKLSIVAKKHDSKFYMAWRGQTDEFVHGLVGTTFGSNSQATSIIQLFVKSHSDRVGSKFVGISSAFEAVGIGDAYKLFNVGF